MLSIRILASVGTLLIALLNLKPMSRRRRGVTVILLVFATMVSVATLAREAVSDRQRCAVEEQTQHQLSAIREQGDSLRTAVAPLRVLAQERYPTLPLAASLRRLARDYERLQRGLDSVAAIQDRDTFTPLAPSIRDSVIKRLVALRRMYGSRRMIADVNWGKDNLNRIRVGEQLLNVFRMAGIEAREHQGQIIGTPGPVAIYVDDEDTQLFSHASAILRPLIGGRVDGRIESATGVGCMQIIIHGVPEFSRAGEVSFK